jgi:hypothetical protein
MSNKYLKKTLTMAQKLQARYNNLNATGTQRVRNPFPMHQLVMEAIPTLVNPNEFVDFTGTVTAKFHGKTIKREITHTVLARHILGDDYIEKSALTIIDLVDTIKSKGYHANAGLVSSAIQQLKAAGLVQGVKTKQYANNATRPYSVYFRPEKV